MFFYAKQSCIIYLKHCNTVNYYMLKYICVISSIITPAFSHVILQKLV